MKNIEIPIGKRTKKYRFFEILPGMISVGAIVLLITLSFFNPLLAALFVLLLVLTMFVKAIGIAFRTIQGNIVLRKSSQVDWAQWLSELENPAKYAKLREHDLKSRKFGHRNHALNLQKLSEVAGEFPKPSEIINAVIIPFVDESYEVLRSTFDNLIESEYDLKHLIMVLTYEERAGEKSVETANRIQKEFKKHFKDFLITQHPKKLRPDEFLGKGSNITFAGKIFAKYIKEKKIDPENVIITTMDCDNRPDKKYFSYLTYEWIMTPNRQRASFQPVCLFTNNIWDAPAPMRVIATGNSFWNVISSMRPHTLRNFASHSQGMAALIGMDFWSTRTIVEDGHQYWRSYFYFDGDYEVVPLRMGIGQDAVLSDNLRKTLKAQFIQLRRWAYGASDVAYVADRLFQSKKKRTVKFWPTFGRFWRLIDGHITLAVMAPIVALGAWVPLFINSEASRNIIVHELPQTVGRIQQVAIIGILVTVILSLILLPPRPKRYRKSRGVMMVLQWFLMPVTAIVYNSAASYTSQVRLMLGLYMEKFDVTEKVVRDDSARKKANRRLERSEES